MEEDTLHVNEGDHKEEMLVLSVTDHGEDIDPQDNDPY